MKSDFLIAVTQLAAERNLPREIVLSAIEAALMSAYRKDSVTAGQDISVKLDPASGDISVYILKTVVEEVTEPQLEILQADAVKIKADAEVGDSIATESLPHSAGRIAAQTAKQVVMQRLREAERDLVYEEFADKEGEVFSVNVQRIEPRQVIVELGRAEALLPLSEQVPAERYRIGQKIRVLLKSLERSTKGPELIVSRADTALLKRLFEMEVPEIFNGAVEIVAIAREPGSRSKVAVRARQDGVDPVGSCVGLRGVRIQSIVNELMGEKIDVMEWTKDPARFIANALSPSQVMRVELDDETQSASAIVPDRQLSLAIGREGQNARLAARLTGWNVDIKSNVEVDSTKAPDGAAKPAVPTDPAAMDLDLLGLSTRPLNILKGADILNVGQLLEMSEADVLAISGFGKKSYVELQGRLKEMDLLAPEPAIEEEAEVEAPVEAPAEEGPPEPVEEPVAKVAEEEAPAEETAKAEPEPVVEEAAPEATPEVVPPETLPEFMPEPVPEPVPVLDNTTALRDVTDDVWSIRRPVSPEPGQIRFAEDIVGLKGGVTARRGRQSERGRRRKAKAGRRRR